MNCIRCQCPVGFRPLLVVSVLVLVSVGGILQQISVSDFISFRDLDTVDEMDTVSSFITYPDTLHKVAKFIVVTPCPDEFFLIRANELAVFYVLSNSWVNNCDRKSRRHV